MRTTVDLPEDIHRIAGAIARDSGTTLSETIARLLRGGARRAWPGPGLHERSHRSAGRLGRSSGHEPGCPRAGRRRVTVLLDANVLIAATVADHVHHDVVEDWFAGRSEPFATCPLTHGALVRFLLRSGATARDALEIVHGLQAADGHEFWPDALGYGDIDMRGVVGHRQVTDAYLAGLTRSRGGRLVTLDRGLAALHDDVALLLDVDT